MKGINAIGTTYGLLGNSASLRGSIHRLLLLGSVGGRHFFNSILSHRVQSPIDMEVMEG